MEGYTSRKYLVSTMPNQMEVVIAAEGGSTRP